MSATPPKATPKRTSAEVRVVPILLQKSFEHLDGKHWFKIEREHATTIQKNRRADSIVSSFNCTEPARRLLQQNLPTADIIRSVQKRAYRRRGPLPPGIPGNRRASNAFAARCLLV